MDDPTYPDLLAAAARAWPEQKALTAADGDWTFADLDYAASEIGGRVPAGSRIAFRAEMSPASVAAVWGIPRGGGVAVPVDPSLDVKQAAAAAQRCGATLGWPEHPQAPSSEAEPTSDAPAYVVATSGSSGRPRGVVLTRGNIVAAAAASQTHLGTRPADVWLLVTPLHHVSGLAILWRSAHDGSRVVLHKGFDAAAVADAMASGVTWVSLVPTMLRRLLDLGEGPWPTLRGALIGGAHAAPDLLAEAQALGVPVLPTYGMTETTAQAATVRPGNAAAAAGTVGHPLPGVEITIDAPPGQIGPIRVAGPTVSSGYVDEPARDGPLVTSDLGRFDSSGRLVVVGRSDDVIVTGGENVHPVSVEAALCALPGVTSAAVVGVADPEWGQRIIAFVSGSGLEGEAVRDSARAVLPRHAVPGRVFVVEDLPYVANGKIDRAALRRAAGVERLG